MDSNMFHAHEISFLVLKGTTEVYGSGTGGVAIISSKLKLLFSLVPYLMHLIFLTTIFWFLEKIKYWSFGIYFSQDHWRVRLEFMLSPMIWRVRGLSLAKQTRPLRCGKRTKLPPLKPIPFISNPLEISGDSSGTFSFISIVFSFEDLK